VILAGGAGERFWPASRRRHPKPLLEVVGGQSLLAATVQRARRFARDRVWLVCGNEHARAMRTASGLPAGRVLVEPQRRNTAMAVAWAAQRIVSEDPDAVMAVLSADHYIPDVAAFASDIRLSARAAAAADVLVTFGVKPTRPETGYGYIHLGKSASRAYPGLRSVRRFVEKPDAATARRYLRSRDYRWNAGIFVWKARTILDEIAVCAPELDRALAPLRRSSRRRAQVEQCYSRAPSLPIDVAVMERSKRVWSRPVDFAWSDVGTWQSLAEELGVGERVSPRRGRQRDHGRTRVIAGEVLQHASDRNLVWARDRLVALVGVEDLAVIDTGDALLVAKLDRSSEVRELVATLKREGRTELT
jgi:mannose-1-phosphate guanylyltransferase/mannose-6-phosphate isomerase